MRFAFHAAYVIVSVHRWHNMSLTLSNHMYIRVNCNFLVQSTTRNEYEPKQILSSLFYHTLCHLKFPNTLLDIKENTGREARFLCNSMLKFPLIAKKSVFIHIPTHTGTNSDLPILIK